MQKKTGYKRKRYVVLLLILLMLVVGLGLWLQENYQRRRMQEVLAREYLVKSSGVISIASIEEPDGIKLEIPAGTIIRYYSKSDDSLVRTFEVPSPFIEKYLGLDIALKIAREEVISLQWKLTKSWHRSIMLSSWIRFRNLLPIQKSLQGLLWQKFALIN
ncbi:MAG: hypothetical protein R3C11_14735 [Planctomycetaceae bacterium]